MLGVVEAVLCENEIVVVVHCSDNETRMRSQFLLVNTSDSADE